MLKEQVHAAGAGAATAPRPEPVTLESGGDRLYAMYYPPTGEPPRGPRVAVLVLEQLGPHRMNVRLSRALAAAGYPVLAVDFRGRGESEGFYDPSGQRHWVPEEMVDDARVALAALRARAAPERVVLFGACQAGHVAARCAATDGADGLVLAGIVNFDDYFREHYRGVLPGLPRVSELPTVDLFETLASWVGPLLLIHGGADPYMSPQRLLEQAERWWQAVPGRHLEMRIVDGGDHTFSARPREQILIAETVAWLERRYGPGYPRAWQGPPPGPTAGGAGAREGGVAAWVPLLVAGARLVREAQGGPRVAWRLELPDGRAYGLTEALGRLVGLIDGHRTVGEISARLSAELGRE